MMKGLLVLAVFLLCLFGLANLIWAVMLWLTRGRHSRKPTMVLLLPHHCADIEPALRSAVFEAESMGSSRCSGILAVDDRLPPEGKAIARAFCDSHCGITLCDSDHLIERLALLQCVCPNEDTIP